MTIGGSSASWDSKGNLTTEPQSGKTYGYSSENLLTSASGGVTLGYDPALRLYQVAAATTTRFAYDGLNVIAEYDGSNALQRRFVFDGSGQPVVWYEGTGTTDRRFMGADERGSIISLTDSAGSLIAINRYDEYGKPQSTNSGRFQYTGQKWIAEINGYDFHFRNYLAHLGIFAQTDPIGYGDGPNLYAYVLNDPVNLVDPLGLATKDRPVVSIPDTKRVNPNECNPENGPCDPIDVVGQRNPRDNSGNIIFASINAAAPGDRTSTESSGDNAVQKISPCMQQFLASKGLGPSNLRSVTFHRGADGSIPAKIAFGVFGNPAITIGNNVYVQPSAWDRGQFQPGTSGFFEETVHTIQWSQSGNADFVSAWIFGSAGGALLSGHGHDSPLEAEAIAMSKNLEREYKNSGGACPR